MHSEIRNKRVFTFSQRADWLNKEALFTMITFNLKYNFGAWVNALEIVAETVEEAIFDADQYMKGEALVMENGELVFSRPCKKLKYSLFRDNELIKAY